MFAFRICPIFQVSNVTGEGLDFVIMVAFDWLKGLTQILGSNILKPAAIQ